MSSINGWHLSVVSLKGYSFPSLAILTSAAPVRLHIQDAAENKNVVIIGSAIGRCHLCRVYRSKGSFFSISWISEHTHLNFFASSQKCNRFTFTNHEQQTPPAWWKHVKCKAGTKHLIINIAHAVRERKTCIIVLLSREIFLWQECKRRTAAQTNGRNTKDGKSRGMILIYTGQLSKEAWQKTQKHTFVGFFSHHLKFSLKLHQ